MQTALFWMILGKPNRAFNEHFSTKTFSVMLFFHIIKREVSMHTVQVLTVSLVPIVVGGNTVISCEYYLAQMCSESEPRKLLAVPLQMLVISRF